MNVLEQARYRLGEVIWEGSSSRTFSAQIVELNRPVLVQTPKSSAVTPRELERLRRGFEFAAEISSQSLVRGLAAVDLSGGRPALIFEDDGSRPARRLIEGGRVELDA